MDKKKLEARKELLLRKKALLEKKAALEAANQVPAPQEQKPMSVAESVRIGAVEGLTLGFADNISGAIGGLLDDGMRATNALGLTGPSPKQVEEQLAAEGATGDGINPDTSAYTEARDARRAELAKSREDNPGTTMASEIVGSIPTMIATGPQNIVAQSAAMGIGAGDGDSLGEMAIDGATGAALGKAATYVGKAAKAIMPKKSGMIYRALKKRFGARKPAFAKEAIGRLESKSQLFTGGKGLVITPEKVAERLKTVQNNINKKLNIVTEKVATNITPDKIKSNFRPIVKDLDGMLEIAVKERKSELVNRLQSTKQMMVEAVENGDYRQVVDGLKTIQDDYVNYTKDGEAKVIDAIRGPMKQFIKRMNAQNSRTIESVGGKKVSNIFSEGMKDLKDIHTISEFVGRNTGQEIALTPTTNDWVAAGTISYLSNQLIATAYMGGSMLFRNPKVQGFLAKSYQQIPRSYDGAKNLVMSPVGSFVKENLPEEVAKGIIPKVEAGMRIPEVQQQLLVKATTSIFPEFFEMSTYNSLVGDRLTDPYEVGLEMDRIRKDDSLSNIEKAKRSRALNKNGQLLRGPETQKGEVAPVAPEEQAQVFNFLDNAVPNENN